MDMERIHEIALHLNAEFDEARSYFNILMRYSLDKLDEMLSPL